MQFCEIRVPWWSIRAVKERLRHGCFSIARRFEEDRICKVMLGLFHDRDFFGWSTGLDVPLNGHKTVHVSTAFSNTEIGQPFSRIAHLHVFLGTKDIDRFFPTIRVVAARNRRKGTVDLNRTNSSEMASNLWEFKVEQA